MRVDYTRKLFRNILLEWRHNIRSGTTGESHNETENPAKQHAGTNEVTNMTENVENKGEEKDDFLPEGGGWREVDTSGAAIYKPETAVAEGADLEGIPYDVILCLGGASDCGVWEAIVFRATKPTVAFRGEEQIVVQPGEDVMIANSALLQPIALKAIQHKMLQHVKLRPTEKKEHATNKKWEYWDFRFALGPMVDREKLGLMRAPERPDIFAKMEEFKSKLNGTQPKREDAKVLASYEMRKRALEQQGVIAALPAA